MYKTGVKIAIVMGMTLVSMLSQAQIAKSPFTSRGIGDVNNFSLAHNQAMGNIGISNGSYWYLNNMNPALLPYNTLTTFAAGLTTERRTVTNETLSETNSGGSLSYLATSFPIMPGKWTTSVGLSPYSTVDYGFTLQDQPVIGNDTARANITEEGSGGFTQLYWSNGYAINKRISVGLKATYIFSSIEKEFSNEIVNSGDAVVFSPSLINRTSVSDFMFQGSVAFNQDSIFNNQIKFNFGATFDIGSTINAERLQSTELQFNDRPISSDTLSNDEGGNIYLPWALGIGTSFSKGLNWTVGLDVRYQPWSEFKSFTGSNENLEDAFSIGLGGEFTPDATSVSSYFKRVTYRVGFDYQNTPYVINGNQINEFGINFGWSLPVSRFSSLDMAFKYGRRGNVSDTILEEEYYRITLGVTFNDQWFIKRKYD